MAHEQEGTFGAFTRAILHIDGDSFFASCEVAKRPWLRGKPVVTGHERGIVSSASPEAKALGVRRGEPIYTMRKRLPEVIVLASDFECYGIYSRRMYDIVRRYTPRVEEYGIDECFGDLTGLEAVHGKPYRAIAREIQETLHEELDITFSIGLAATKVLAKLGSKYQKPNGLTVIPEGGQRPFLETTPVGHIWGIGYRTAPALEQEGIRTALQFIEQPESWIRNRFSKPHIILWKELRGESVLTVSTEQKAQAKSLQRTHTFSPATTDRARLLAELSRNIESACRKARREGLYAAQVSIFLKTQAFRFHTAEASLPYPTNAPQDILRTLHELFTEVYHPRTLYRATGVTLYGLRNKQELQLDLFGSQQPREKLERVFQETDRLEKRYGRGAIFLASSLPGREQKQHRFAKGLPLLDRLYLPYLGEVD